MKLVARTNKPNALEFDVLERRAPLDSARDLASRIMRNETKVCKMKVMRLNMSKMKLAERTNKPNAPKFEILERWNPSTSRLTPTRHVRTLRGRQHRKANRVEGGSPCGRASLERSGRLVERRMTWQLRITYKDFEEVPTQPGATQQRERRSHSAGNSSLFERRHPSIREPETGVWGWRRRQRTCEPEAKRPRRGSAAHGRLNFVSASKCLSFTHSHPD